jgi:hypothetical protein
LINSSQRTLSIENEEIASVKVIRALISATKRGVQIRQMMSNNNEWDENFAKLANAGAQIKLVSISQMLIFTSTTKFFFLITGPRAETRSSGRRTSQMFRLTKIVS